MISPYNDCFFTNPSCPHIYCHIYFMNCWYVSIQAPTLFKNYITNLATERFLPFMNWWFSFLAKLTNVTFERLTSYMNWNNMVIQICFLQNLHHSCAFERLIFFMNCFYVSIQITLLWKTSITYIAIEWLFPSRTNTRISLCLFRLI